MDGRRNLGGQRLNRLRAKDRTDRLIRFDLSPFIAQFDRLGAGLQNMNEGGIGNHGFFQHDV
ncbi:hypothetical protein HMSSN036_82940 [Paenibacillus macerans]|nr:hypothetical protein HMSSN036_82940 [Paenibacillus macerans]